MYVVLLGIFPPGANSRVAFCDFLTFCLSSVGFLLGFCVLNGLNALIVEPSQGIEYILWVYTLADIQCSISSANEGFEEVCKFTEREVVIQILDSSGCEYDLIIREDITSTAQIQYIKYYHFEPAQGMPVT